MPFQVQEEGKISNLQLFMMIAGFTLGSATLFPPGSGVRQDNWLAILLGLAEGIVFASVYLALTKRFPGKTLIEITELVWGPYFGKLLSVAFLCYLFHLGSLAITLVMNFIKFTLLPATPVSVFVLFGISICFVAASGGIEVLARSFAVLVILAIAVSLFVDVMLLPQFKLENLQPVLETPLPRLLAAGHRAATFPFGDTVAFLMLIPFLNAPRKANPSIFAGLIIAGLVLTTASIRNTGVLGATTEYFLYPSYSSSRLINVGEIFSRIELLIGINFITTNFIKITLLIYSFMLGTAQLCRLKSYRTLTVPVWILISLLAIHNYSNVVESQEFLRRVYPFYSLPFQVGIPFFTWIMALIRKLPHEGSKCESFS
jgi:spore germination protein KB